MALPSAQFPYVVRHRHDVLATPAESGAIHRRAQNARRLREWAIEWPLLTSAQKADIITEYDSTKGGASAFTWTDPDGASVTAWFAEPVEYATISNGWYSARTTLRVDVI